MWSKLPILVATAVFLIAVCIPVTANDGGRESRLMMKIRRIPWGGDQLTTAIDPSTCRAMFPMSTGDWYYYFTGGRHGYY